MREASAVLPVPEGPVRRIGASDAVATRSTRPIRASKAGSRVAMPALSRASCSRGDVEAAPDGVASAEIEVDDVERALGRAVRAPGRGGLDQPRGDVAGLGQEEPADLGHARVGGQADGVALAVLVAAVGPGEVEQGAVQLPEVPGGRAGPCGAAAPRSRARPRRSRPGPAAPTRGGARRGSARAGPRGGADAGGAGRSGASRAACPRRAVCRGSRRSRRA